MSPFRRTFAVALLALLVLGQLPLAALNPAVAAPPPGTPTPANAVPGQLLIVFETGTADAEQDTVVGRRGGRTLRKFEGIGARLVALPSGKSVSAARVEFAAEPAVRYTQPNYLYTLDQVPNEPIEEFSKLWGLHNIGQTVNGLTGTADADIDAPEAWDITTGSRSVVVGIVDTGILHTHPDLAANIWTAPAGWTVKGCGAGTHGYRNSPQNGSTPPTTPVVSCDPIDEHSHGTHVAGTIGAVGNNDQGVVGVNWSVQLMALRFFNDKGIGNTAGAIDVIDYAIKAKQAGVNLRVLNNSWTGTVHDQALLDQINAANAEGILVVAAAGNQGSDNDTAAIYPANYPNVLSVAATDHKDDLADFSNYGPTTVHLGAPGARIYSTTIDNPNTLDEDYSTKSGTSMAAPHVSGAAALLLSVPGFGNLSPAELRARLMDCGDEKASLVGKTISGKRLNVDRTIRGTDGCAPPPPPNPLPAIATITPPNGLVGGDQFTLTVNGSNFVTTSLVRWNGANQPTSYVSSTQLTATIPATLLASSGTANITVFNPAPEGGSSENRPFSVKIGQSIQFDTLPDKNYGDPSFNVNATASSDLAVSFAASGDCTISESTVTLTGTGTCTITAAQAGNATYAPAPDVTRTFAIAPATPPSPSPSPSPSPPITPTLYTFALVQMSGGTATANRGPGQYSPGEPITLNATPNADQLFTGWLVDGQLRSYANPAQLILSGNRTVTPSFAARQSYSDVSPVSAAYEAITQLAARGVIRGYTPQGCAAQGHGYPCFGPNNQVTRAEMATLIARAMGWDAENHDNPFTDRGGLDESLWRNVGTLAHYKVALGYGNGKFGPNDKVTYAQTISFVSRAMVVKGFWQAHTVPPAPAPYGGVLNGTGHQNDVATYLAYTVAAYGGVPDHPASGGFADWSNPSSRGWFARALWAALLSQYGAATIP